MFLNFAKRKVRAALCLRVALLEKARVLCPWTSVQLQLS